MKLFISSLILAAFLFGCKKDTSDPSKQFPGCVGITGDFNPYSISKPYYVTLTGPDILNVRMTFTNFEGDHLWILTNWQMWVGVHSQSSYKYYGGYCSYYYGTKQWYGDSGIDYNGQYASLHFDFDIFTCNEVSGSCYLVQLQTSDTLHYSFEGTR
jgi:hypothetical protein